MNFISATQGWLVTENPNCATFLWHTVTGGRTWTNVTPAGVSVPSPGSIGCSSRQLAGSAFLNGNDAFVPVDNDAPSITQEVSTIYGTHNAGKTWQRLAAIGGGKSQLTFFNLTQGFDVDMGGVAAGSSGLKNLSTSDGGLSWKQLAEAEPSGRSSGGLDSGCDTSAGFNSPKLGWVTGFCSGPQQYFYRSTDGGRKWVAERLPDPQQLAGVSLASLMFSPAPPKFFNAQDGVDLVGIWVPPQDVEEQFVYTTSNAGRSWSSAVTAVAVPQVDFVNRSNWCAIQGPNLLETSNAGASWTTLSLGFTFPAGGFASLDFASPITGWVDPTADAEDSDLWLATDSGHVWRQWPVPGLSSSESSALLGPRSHLGPGKRSSTVDAEWLSVGGSRGRGGVGPVLQQFAR
jgi:photosystem II stability/assembly factor-like uncharacterized protein